MILGLLQTMSNGCPSEKFLPHLTQDNKWIMYPISRFPALILICYQSGGKSSTGQVSEAGAMAGCASLLMVTAPEARVGSEEEARAVLPGNKVASRRRVGQ